MNRQYLSGGRGALRMQTSAEREAVRDVNALQQERDVL